MTPLVKRISTQFRERGRESYEVKWSSHAFKVHMPSSIPSAEISSTRDDMFEVRI